MILRAPPSRKPLRSAHKNPLCISKGYEKKCYAKARFAKKDLQLQAKKVEFLLEGRRKNWTSKQILYDLDAVFYDKKQNIFRKLFGQYGTYCPKTQQFFFPKVQLHSFTHVEEKTFWDESCAFNAILSMKKGPKLQTEYVKIRKNPS